MTGYGGSGYGAPTWSPTPFFDTKTMIDEILKATGMTDPTASAQRRCVALNFINTRYMQLAKAKSWTWLNSQFDLNILEPEEAGTVTMTEGSTTVTGVGTTFDVVHEGAVFIAKTGDRNRYRIASVTTATELELTSRWTDETASGDAYQISMDRYSMPGNLKNITSVSIDEISELVYKDPEQFRMLKQSDPTNVGRPQYYTQRLSDENKRYVLELFPFPDGLYSAHIPYSVKIVPLLDEADDVSFVPDRHTDVLFWMALADMQGYVKDRAAAQDAKREGDRSYVLMCADKEMLDVTTIFMQNRNFRAKRRRRGRGTSMTLKQFGQVD